MVAEPRLREALAPHRPSPDEFAEGVSRRIREAEERGARQDEEGAALLARSPFLRRAAAILPPGILPGPLLMAAGKKAGLKGAPALLALPAVSLLLLGLIFTGALASLARPLRSEARIGEPGDDALHRQAVRAWWRANWWKPALGLGLIAGLLILLPAEAAVILVLVSMVALVAILEGLRRAGYGSRPVIAGRCCGFLITLGAMVMPLESVLIPGGTPFAVSASLLGGGILCGLLAIRGAPASHPALWVAPAAFLLPVIVLMVWPMLITSAGRDDLVAWVESFEDAELNSARWSDWSLVASWLKRDPSSPPLDLSRPAAALHAALDRDQDANSYTLLSAARLDLLRQSDWQARADRHSVRQLLVEERPRPLPGYAHLDIRTLLNTREFDEDERDHIASRIVAIMPRKPEHGALHALWEGCETLELLDRGHLADELAADARTVLLEMWRGSHRASPEGAGFTNNVDFARKDRLAEFFQQGATFEAIDLMGRFGIPEDLDLARVARFCRGAAAPNLPWRRTFRPYQLVLEAARENLEASLPYRRPSPWSRLVANRLLVGVLLLVGLCLFAVFRAPSGRRSEPGGAARAP